jgi:thioredoxin-like negative regulator of GroEL
MMSALSIGSIQEVQMLSKRKLIVLTASIIAALAVPAVAEENVGYSNAAFEAALKAGRPILVEVHAPWCSTCKAQEPILGAIVKQDAYKNLLVVQVDFDSQKDALKRFGVRTQSTLIVFKGGKEIGRSVGDTNQDSIAALLAKTI